MKNVMLLAGLLLVTGASCVKAVEQIIPEVQRLAGQSLKSCEPLNIPVSPALHFPADIAVSQDGQTVYVLNGECLGYNRFLMNTSGVGAATGCVKRWRSRLGLSSSESFDFYQKFIYEITYATAKPEIFKTQGKPPLSCVLGTHLEIDSEDRLYVTDELNQRIYRVGLTEIKQLAEIDEIAFYSRTYPPGDNTWLTGPRYLSVSGYSLYYDAFASDGSGASHHRVGGIDLSSDTQLKKKDYMNSGSPEYLLTYLTPHFYTGFLPQIFHPERANQIYNSEGKPIAFDSDKVITEPAYIPLSGPVEALQQQVGEIGAVYNVAARSEADRNLFYYSDSSRHVIYRVMASKDHELLDFSIFAGSPAQAGLVDGAGAAARFYAPSGLSLDAAGNLFVSDTANHAIRKITPAGEVSTFYRETQPYVPRFAYP